MAAAVEELPEELMTLILVKLPVKTLLRLKCVQKSWYSLIKSPQFVRLHLHHRSSSCSTGNSINFDCFIVRRFHRKQHFLSLHSYETLDDLGNQINIHFSQKSRFSAVLCGSCDGLVCLSNFKDQILICNPTIREFRSLFVPPPLGNRSGFDIDSVAFGSDPNTGQYAVLMIGDDHGGARLYDFSSDSWRETAAVFPPGQFAYFRRALSFNGAFHWRPWYHHSNILTFHISNEVTGSIPLPDFVVDFSHEMELCVSTKSQLSLVLNKNGRFEICVMTEYGVKESWTRLFNVGPLAMNFLRPIPFWDEQRLLFRNGEQGQLVSCDLQHHQNLRRFPIHGDFDLYSQSLVSVNGIGHPII